MSGPILSSALEKAKLEALKLPEDKKIFGVAGVTSDGKFIAGVAVKTETESGLEWQFDAQFQDDLKDKQPGEFHIFTTISK